MALEVVEVESVAAALDALAEYGEDAKVVAGGTALTLMLRQRLLDPTALIAVGRMRDPGLRDIAIVDGKLALGALVTIAEVERSQVVRQHLPVLCEVFGVVGNIRVRHAATVGGVVAEADYASDPPCALLALDAEVVVAGPDGERVVPFADFVLGFYETVLEPEELVTAVRVPLPPAGASAVYAKYRTRSSEDRPCVGVLAEVRLQPGGACQSVRVAVGAASERAERFPELEAGLVGASLDEAAAAALADAYAERIDTLTDMRGSAAYRREMVRVWVRRSLLAAADAAARGGQVAV